MKKTHAPTPSDITEAITQAEALQTKGDQQGAMQAYKVWLERASTSSNAWVAHFNLGVLQKESGDLAGALTSFENALQQNPSLSQAKEAIQLIAPKAPQSPSRQQGQPFFSVIVPTHKRAVLLRRALMSITQQEAIVPFEIIVISDAADAETDKVCRTFLSGKDIYIRRNGSAGPSASRNMGLSLAQGRYVLFLDDDDAWHPDLLTQLSHRAEVQRGLPVYFNCTVVNESRLPEGPVTLSEDPLDLAGRLTDEVYVKNQVHMSCLAFPRALLAGLSFDTHMRAYEDWDFQLAAYAREWPCHVPIWGSRVFEVRDSTTDRRGQTKAAHDFNALLDYLYVYRRQTAPTSQLKQKRANFLETAGLKLAPDLL